MEHDPRFANEKLRSQNRAAVNEAIGAITQTKTSREWIEALNAASVPCGPIYHIDEVFADPQVRHLGMAAPVHSEALGDLEVVNQAIETTRTPSRVVAATPECGAHTDEVLRELGYDDQAIGGLRARKVV
jgi:crotonobetainyl-CoA:carnitine CoA-transferase CaiB-like acyl-CoA transferase